MKVFISGSRSITQLDRNAVDLIFRAVNEGAEIIVGDADGVDSAVQQLLRKIKYPNVTVFAMNGRARNHNDFKINSIKNSKDVHFKKYYSEKDVAMTNEASLGLIIWDGESKGTLNNLKRLNSQHKECIVYLQNEQKWKKMFSFQDIKNFKSKDKINDMESRLNIEQISFV